MSEQLRTAAIEPAYGRFSRRLKAVVIDSVILTLALVAALFAAVAAGSDHVGRILGTTVAAVWLLYEPLLVSATGSTVGHYLTNLRVVDNRSHGNISFMKAVARAVIKAVLGIYSFVTMGVSLRHQAVHDLVTGSTVQIRDLGRARPRDYVTAGAKLRDAAMPSTGRRIAIIAAYVVATDLVVVIAAGLLAATGSISPACLDDDWCSSSDNALVRGLGVAFVALPLLCIIQGWRGRLYGCRRRRDPAAAFD